MPTSKKYSKNLVLGRDLDGKQIRRKISSNSKAQLNQIEYDIRREYEKRPSRIIFEVYSKKWLENKKLHCESATYENYCNALKHCGSLDRIQLADIRKSDIQDIINSLWSHPASARMVKTALMQIFDCAVDDEIILKNPVKNVNMPKQKSVQRNFLTSEHKAALVRANLSDKERLFVDVLYSFGVRPGEALALTEADFDFKKSELTINKAVGYDKNGNGYLKETKTGTARVLPIPDEFSERYADRFKNSGIYLFPSKNSGGIMCKSSEKRMWKRIKAKWNIEMGGNEMTDVLGKDIRPYTFRQNYATDLYYSDISIKKAAELMGHSDTTMLLKIYAQLDNERENLKELMNRRMSTHAEEDVQKKNKK